MKHKPLFRYTMYAIGVLMALFALVMLNALHSIASGAGWNLYGVFWLIMGASYLVGGLYIIVNRRKSLVACITIVLVLQVVSAAFNYMVSLRATDDLAFAKAVVSMMLVLLDFTLLMLYLMGFRRSSRRLFMLLGLQAYFTFLELLVAIHFSRVVVETLFMNFQSLFNLIIYGLLMILLCNRSVSDLPLNRMARYNSERLYTSMVGGTLISISDEGYAAITSSDRSSWAKSADPEIDLELVIPAKDRYGTYEMLLQKRHDRDALHLVFHDAVSFGYLNSVTMDLMHIVELEFVYGCRKVRFYGDDGMFIDILVGEPNLRADLILSKTMESENIEDDAI
ncbi:MAG: hypothetical protein J6R75_03365 [Candidatus Methanomethylophilaceae archaeon]|nr:hypothetical protein [Candidatus Methanomethylophilaceae archaeon]